MNGVSECYSAMPPKRKKGNVVQGEQVPALETGSGAPPTNGDDNGGSKVCSTMG